MVNYNETKFWNKVAHSYHKVSIISKAHQEKFERIAELILKNNLKKILDVGCGSGILEKKLIEKGFDGKIIAIDSSEKMLNTAKEFVGKKANVKFELLDIKTPLPYEENSFDGIVAINIMFLLRDVEEFLEESKRILKNGGLFFPIDPKSKSNILEFFSNYAKKYLPKMSGKEILLYFLNLHHIVRVIMAQQSFDNLNKKGIIFYREREEIQKLLEEKKFEVLLACEIQLGQNWFFLARNIKNNVD